MSVEYVEIIFREADEFTRPLQEATTVSCLGFSRSDEVFDANTRSVIKLSRIGALGKYMSGNYTRAAINIGVIQDESRAIIRVIRIITAYPKRWSIFERLKKCLILMIRTNFVSIC